MDQRLAKSVFGYRPRKIRPFELPEHPGDGAGCRTRPCEPGCTLSINAVELKYILRKIDTNHDNVLHGWLLFPCGS